MLFFVWLGKAREWRQQPVANDQHPFEYMRGICPDFKGPPPV